MTSTKTQLVISADKDAVILVNNTKLNVTNGKEGLFAI
jgi:hypothetical protein